MAGWQEGGLGDVDPHIRKLILVLDDSQRTSCPRFQERHEALWGQKAGAGGDRQ